MNVLRFDRDEDFAHAPGLPDSMIAESVAADAASDAERAAAVHARDAREASLIADLQGDPPDAGNTFALSPRRAALANFLKWRQGIADELAALETRKAQLEALISAPAETEAKVRSAVKRTADFLLGRNGADNADEAGRKALDDELSARRHRAESAQAALPQLLGPIETASLRLKTISERQDEFLKPALAELADEVGLGRQYMRKIAELQEIAKLVYGLADVAGGYDSGFEMPTSIKLPRSGIPSTKHQPLGAFTIPAAGDAEIWRKAAQALLADPHVKAAKLVSLPK
jgi:hypothetical protein